MLANNLTCDVGAFYLNIWNTFVSSRPEGQPPTVRGGVKSGNACEHWDRLEEDLGLIRGLGVGSYRYDASFIHTQSSSSSSCLAADLRDHIAGISA